MLENITIKSYKRIEKIQLTKLAKVSYLVGKNGSGKSSVLEALGIVSATVGPADNHSGTGVHETEHLSIDIELDGGLSHTLKEIVNSPENMEEFGPLSNLTFISYIPNRVNYFATSDSSDQFPNVDPDAMEPGLRLPIITKEKHQINDDDLLTIKIIEECIGEGRISERIEQLNEHDQLFAIGLGYSHLLNLVAFLRSQPQVHSASDEHTKVILIDEPEFGLNPEIEKSVAAIFDYCATNFDLQLLIATHSPFIIGGASKYTTSKVYLIQDGTTVDRSKSLNSKTEGYRPKEMNGIASEMLGASVKDLTITPSGLSDSPYEIIYVEGANEANSSDANIYRTLFPSNPTTSDNIIWLSIGGATNVLLHSFYSLEQLQLIFGENVKVSHVIDRSCSTGIYTEQLGIVATDGTSTFTSQEITAIEKQYPHSYVLSRREIENYLFTHEIIIKYLETNPEKRIISNELIDQYFIDNDIRICNIKDEIGNILQNTTILDIAKFATGKQYQDIAELENDIFR